MLDIFTETYLVILRLYGKKKKTLPSQPKFLHAIIHLFVKNAHDSETIMHLSLYTHNPNGILGIHKKNKFIEIHNVA